MAYKVTSHPSSREGHRTRATTDIMRRKKTVWKCLGVFGETTARNGRTPLLEECDMPKYIAFDAKKSTIQIIHKNQNQELHGYPAITNDVPLVFVNNKLSFITDCMDSLHFYMEEKHTSSWSSQINGRPMDLHGDLSEVPNVSGCMSGCSIDYKMSTQIFFEFDFENITLKVKIDIKVADKSLDVPYDEDLHLKLDILKLYELKHNPGHRGNDRIRDKKRWRLKDWEEKKKLWEIRSIKNIETKNQQLRTKFPVIFKTLSYENYQDKFNTLLYMNEIEINIALQTYAQKRVQFEKKDEYLVLKIPNLSERRPSLIPYDFIVIEPYKQKSSRKGGNLDRYQGIIHKVSANEIQLMFDPHFHKICGVNNEWYKVNFFHNSLNLRKQQDIVQCHGLDEKFLFPKYPVEYKSPKMSDTTTTSDTDTETAYIKIKRKGKIRSIRQKDIKNITWCNGDLNVEQKSVVINILKGEGRPLPYIIYGPPGTGKTITLVESIIQTYREFPENKLLICAPTNTSVYLLLNKLIKFGSFEPIVMKRIVSISYSNNPLYDNDYGEYTILADSKNLYSVRSPEKNDSKSIKENDLPELRILLTTECMASTLRRMGFVKGKFSHIFIDEAGQSMEPDILFPLSFLDENTQVILSGDPKQLGPVVMSKDAKELGLGTSMLARFINIPKLYKRDLKNFPEHNGYNPRLITCLIKNYRSLPEIVYVFSSLFYNNVLVPTKTQENDEERIFLNKLYENPHWIRLASGCKGPVIVHGVNGSEKRDENNPSWYNPHEVLYVFLYFVILSEAGISADDIGIITPYLSQVAKIKLLLKKYYPHAEKLPKVSSVELFQGQERMVIIISLVRSLAEKETDDDKGGHFKFLATQERINVAISRAKSLVVVIGNPSTMKNNKWETILSDAKKNNNYHGCKF